MSFQGHAMTRSETIGYVHSLESFGCVDGPGVRFVVFLHGCNLRCRYCHNPDTWAEKDAPLQFTAEALFERCWKYHTYWGKDGGITVSGGEPLLQIDFLIEFFSIAKEHGVHTTIDTAGQPFSRDELWLSKFNVLLGMNDLIILDLKEIDPQKHISLTGRDNASILDMAQYVSDHGVPLWIRHVLVPGLTDDAEGLKQTAAFIASLKTVERTEVLPYHTLGITKWKKLGIPYSLENVPVPGPEEIKRAEELLQIRK
jgi:pyruvate formate lyase activating enzyme